MKLQNLSILELLIEWMYMGKAEGIVPNATAIEPINIDNIRSEIEKRCHLCLNDNFQDYYKFFVGKSSPLNKKDIDTLKNLMDFKVETDPLFKILIDREKGVD